MATPHWGKAIDRTPALAGSAVVPPTAVGMRHRVIVPMLLMAALGAVPAQAQHSNEASSSDPVRLATISGGVGNSHGWYGVQGEWHLPRGRAGVFAGVGYTPRERPGDPSGMTGSAGVRVYTRGARHRWFAEGSVSQIGVERAGLRYPKGRHIYGPGAQLGYEYLAAAGLTLALSGGLGYGIGVSNHANPWQPMLGLSCGYTWRSD